MPAPRVQFTVLNTPLSGHEVEVSGAEPITVGRTSDNTLVLDHKSVSRRHALIEANGDAFVLTDLDSHNGTRVGSELVEGQRVIQPGETLSFGEVQVQFALAQAGEDPGTAPPTTGVPADQAQDAALPAVVGEGMAPAAPGERPLSFEDVFGQGAAAEQPEGQPAPVVRRGVSPLLYSVTLIVILILGGLAIWRVGYRPPGPPVVGLQVRSGDIEPVNLAKHLRRVTRIGDPESERVAFAKATKFPFIVTVHGRSGGSTDISVYGPPAGEVILRVVVAGVKPPPSWEEELRKSPSQRVERANERLRRAEAITPKTGVVNEKTSQAIRDYEIASKLLANIPGQEHRATQAAKRARELRQARDKRFDQLAQLIDARRREGNYAAADRHAQELLRIFSDPDSPENAVIRFYYEVLQEEAARAAREAEERR